MVPVSFKLPLATGRLPIFSRDVGVCVIPYCRCTVLDSCLTLQPFNVWSIIEVGVQGGGEGGGGLVSFADISFVLQKSLALYITRNTNHHNSDFVDRWEYGKG